jgi:hypothetical protein
MRCFFEYISCFLSKDDYSESRAYSQNSIRLSEQQKAADRRVFQRILLLRLENDETKILTFQNKS